MASSFLPSTSALNVKKFDNRTPAPAASAAQFVNQRLSGLMNGTSAEVGGAKPLPVGLTDPATRVGDDNSVAASTARRMKSIQDSTNRLTQYAALKKANQAQAAASKASVSVPGAGPARGGKVTAMPTGNMASAGRAYTPNGRLSNVRNQVLRDASSFIGTKYVLGGTTTRGIDCSGLLMRVYNKLGYKLPHHSGIQSRTIPGVRTSLSNLRPGDIVAWKDGSHIGIYAGNGYIIDAANRKINTTKRKINMNRGDVYGIALKLPGE